jgi:peptidoglycan hydrolase CwlO-like protein
MLSKITRFFLFFAIFLFISVGFFVVADTSKEEEKAQLEEELRIIEEEIRRAEQNIDTTEAEKRNLESQINRLQNEISYLSAQINRNHLVIQNLGLEIADTEDSIEKTSQKIEESREELAEMLRMMRTEERTTTLEVFLTEDNLSAVFSRLNSLERLSKETSSILDEVKDLKISLENQKQGLELDKEETERVARVQELQKAEEEAAREERERLYGLTEAEYQAQLAEKQELEKKADEIRNRLFELVGIPDVESPTFEEAYEIAKWVEGITGIRPAFLLSILQQESAFGKNVGQCYLADTTSGAAVHIRSGLRYHNGIHPTRDIPPFLTITRELGKDPLKTAVSCPLSYGYGGAMGPAQFIPSTWMMYRDRLNQILGRPANPWTISDSFLASGVLLTDSGARSQTRDGEWRAAMIYFSGGTTNSTYFWYANQVVDRADQFEKDIEIMLRNNN